MLEMREGLVGRKLLILGAYSTEIEIVECARKLGVASVVTDSHADWSLAPAKRLADEAWGVSWSDIDALAERSVREGVNGVIAGFSERRIACAQALAERMGWPFYADGADLDSILHKARFKEACRRQGVDVARSFEAEDEAVEYPVIVKPSDNGGSRGITICHEPEELASAVDKAMLNSDSGSIEIEEYIVADEVMVYYVVHNGIPSLSAMCDRHMFSFDKRITQLPVGYRFPSKHLGLFKRKHDARFRELIRGLGIRNGLIAFQSFVIGDRVVPFDPTFRLDGTMAYHTTEEANGSNVLAMLIAHSLTGSMGDDDVIDARESANIEGIHFELPILLGKGTVAEVRGVEEVRAMGGVYFVSRPQEVGAVMGSVADFSQMLCRIQLRAEDESDLERKLAAIFEVVKVLDEDGEDMVIYRDASSLASGRVER